MEIIQFITLIVAILGSAYSFFRSTQSQIDIIINQHREDMALHKIDIRTMDNNHREDMKSMDSKWERLFEKLLIKEQE